VGKLTLPDGATRGAGQEGSSPNLGMGLMQLLCACALGDDPQGPTPPPNRAVTQQSSLFSAQVCRVLRQTVLRATCTREWVTGLGGRKARVTRGWMKRAAELQWGLRCKNRLCVCHSLF